MAKGVGSVKITLDTRRLDALRNGLAPRAKAVLDKAAFDVEAGWKEEIVAKKAIDTGNYLNSVHVEPVSDPHKRTIADGTEYGILIEGGTSRMPARPCAAPAVERVRKPFEKAWEKLFE